MQIFVKTPSEKVISISVDASETVESLKKKIAEKEKVPCEEQRLIFSGKQLVDSKTIEEYNIQNDSTLNLMLSLKGGILPLSLLTAALVELKNGETYNGKLVSCDGFMNMELSDVIYTAKDNSTFWKMPKCLIRGNSIKYTILDTKVVEKAKAEEIKKAKENEEIENRGRFRGRN